MELSEMTGDEKSLLLFLECRSVDHGGLVDPQHMSKIDVDIAKRWNDSGFVGFGWLASDCLPMRSSSTHWCELSEEAWFLAHAERRERYKRMNEKRTWFTTAEKRAS